MDALSLIADSFGKPSTSTDDKTAAGSPAKQAPSGGIDAIGLIAGSIKAPIASDSVKSFVEQYKPLADRISKSLGVAPEALLGQWGLETGWGKSIIPGTNNLGNIKDVSGRGARAKDNMTGSVDAYRTYGNAEEFGDDFASLLGRRYKSAIGSGADSQRYFQALKASGYAEDPDYVNKGVAATRMAAGALGMAGAGGQSDAAPKKLFELKQAAPVESDGISGMGKALWQGIKSTARSIGATGNTYLGNLSDVELAAEAQKVAAAEDPQALQALQQEIAARKEANPGAGVLDAASAVLGAAWDNKAGTAQLIASQAPNSAVALGGAYAGGKAGAIAGSAFGPAGTLVGGALGTLAGMFLGNLVLETGGKAIEKAEGGFTPEERVETIREGGIKAGVVTGVDALTFKAGGAVASALNRGAIKAGAKAEAKVLADAGINIADGAEVVAALSKNPALRDAAIAAGKSASSAASSTSRRVGTGGALLTSETAGEYSGEYFGELAATGKADPYDAALEAIASFSQSAPQAMASMVKSAGNRLDIKEIVSAAPELAPVAEKAAEPNSPLSKAAMAANTPEVVAQRQAEQAAVAAESAPPAAPANANTAARLAELESIGEDRPAQTIKDDQGRDVEIPAEPGRFFTQEEKDEYDDLKARRDSTPGAKPKEADTIADRAKEIAAAVRESGALETLRSPDSPVKASDLVKDLATAQSPNTPAAAREQALGRVEFALQWAGIDLAPRAAQNADAPGDVAAESAKTGAAQVDPVIAAMSDPKVSAADKTALRDAYNMALNTRLPQATRDQALTQAREIAGRYAAAPAATAAPAAAQTPAVLGPIDGAPGTLLAQAERMEQGAFEMAAEDFPEEAQQLRAQADSLREEAATARAGETGQELEAEATADAVSPEAQQSVALPTVKSTPSGDGPAYQRRRRASLQQLAANGFTTVRRDGDKFAMVNPKTGQSFSLEGAADAQMARKAVADNISSAAAQTNTDPTDGQKSAGNYKKARVDFEGVAIAIENPVGSERKGKADNGEAWATPMNLAHYGYIPSTTAADGDGVDVYVMNTPRIGAPAYVIDQYNEDGSFDETKTVLGASSEAEALRVYDAGFSDGSGPDRRGAVTAMPIADFKVWAQSPAAKKAAGPAPETVPGAEVEGSMKVKLSKDESVDVDLVKALPEVESVARGGRATRISKKQGAVIEAIAQAFGKKVQFYTGANSKRVGDGFILPADQSTIYLNATSSMSPLVVFGHELLHQLKRDNPEAHAAIVAVVARHMNRDATKAVYGKLGYSDDQIMEELVSDLGGDLMADKSFWADVMAEVREANGEGPTKKILAQLAEFLYRAIGALTKNLRSYADTGAGSKLVDDMTEIRAAFQTALAGYMQTHGIAKPSMQAEILRAGQDAKRSAARQADLFPKEMATKRATVATKRLVSSKGDTEKGVNIDSTGSQITSTRQGLENFWRWFGDSQAVADNGRPLVMYHSTNGDITEFEQGRVTTNNYGLLGDVEVSRSGIFVSPDREFSQEYLRSGGGQNVMQVYLKIENPADMRHGISSSFVNEMESAGVSTRWLLNLRDIWEAFDNTDEGSNDFVDALKKSGYDGAIFNEADRDGRERPTYVAFSPEQLKSATGNRGTFDPADPSIIRSADRSTKGAAPRTGVHYSQQPRDLLDGRKYGTGMRGVESERLGFSRDPRILERVYAYVNGANPESNVGRFAHEVELGDNLYDAATDQLKLWAADDLNSVETAVLDAGFDGYYTPTMAVILGDASRAVKATLSNGDTERPTIKKALMSREIREIDVGSIPGAKMRAGILEVPAGNVSAANAELERIGSPVKFSTARENKHGFIPALLDTVKGKIALPEKALFTQSTSNANATRQIDSIDKVLRKFPAPENSANDWNRMMAHALADRDVPVAPYRMIGAINGAGYGELLAGLTPGQVADADHGFENAAEFRKMYESGQADVITTGKLALWSFLSRGVSPYVQESLFMDAVENIDPWIEMAAAGKFDEAAVARYRTWSNGIAPAGSGQPGSGSKHNLNAFGGSFLFGMSKPGRGGKPHLQHLHELIADFGNSGPEIRRELAKFGEGVGIDNKVVSFTLLVSGRDDVMVLDRVQIKGLWDDGRFGGRNLYDGETNELKKIISGSKLADLFSGVRGLLTYEAIERAIGRNMGGYFAQAGRPEAASLGRFHWETWVAYSGQEASHGTIVGLMNNTAGKTNPYLGITAKEGEYGNYAYGVRYGLDSVGQPYFLYDNSDGDSYRFSVPALREMLELVKKPSSKVVPTNFLVSKDINESDGSKRDRSAPWFADPRVNRAKLDKIIEQFGSKETRERPLSQNGEKSDSNGARSIARSAGRDGGEQQLAADQALPGSPRVEGATGPDHRLVAVAEAYAQKVGIDFSRQAEYVQVDEERAARIAAAYEAMEHAPQDRKVRAAYADLIKQTRAQYDALVEAGYSFYFADQTNDPYGGNPWNAMRDLRANRQMAVFPTAAGFGSNETFDPADNPLLADTGLTWGYGSADGQSMRVLANDLFRAVHDAFGHGLEGAGFRAQGEENAWQGHIRMFTGAAKGAITSETRGQNSWLNYNATSGEANRTAKVEDTVFADQKTGLMPEWTWSEGLAADAARSAERPWAGLTEQEVEKASAGYTEFSGFEQGAFWAEDQLERRNAGMGKWSNLTETEVDDASNGYTESDGFRFGAFWAGDELESRNTTVITKSVSRDLPKATLADFEPRGISRLLGVDNWAILTAENPMGEQAGDKTNAAAMRRLRQRLAEMDGVEFRAIRGKYGDNEENSLAVVGITEEQAKELGREFNQDSVLTRKGFIYQDGSINPATGIEVFRNPPENYYSRIGDTIFRIDIDFDKKIDPAADAKQQQRIDALKELIACLGK